MPMSSRPDGIKIETASAYGFFENPYPFLTDTNFPKSVFENGNPFPFRSDGFRFFFFVNVLKKINVYIIN